MVETIALFTAVIAALVTGGFGIFNAVRLGQQNEAIEKLKTRLGHGQLIRSTQWNAEFGAYQSLWKSTVAVRVLAIKLIRREEQLPTIGIEPGDVTEESILVRLHELHKQYAAVASDLVSAINDNAPFYLAGIRSKAAEAHDAAALIQRETMSVLVARTKKQSPPANRAIVDAALEELIALTDSLEAMIRARLEEVRVVD